MAGRTPKEAKPKATKPTAAKPKVDQPKNADEQMDLGYYRVEVIAKLFGISVRRVQQLVQEGVISTVKVGRGTRFELTPTVQKYIEYLTDKAYGKAKSETEVKLKEKKLRAEVALKESQGELHRLRTEIAAGKYITIEEVKIDYSRFFITFKKFAMSIPSKLAGRLTGFVDPVEVRRLESEMQNDVTKLLKGFVVAATVEEKSEGADGKT